MRILLLGANGQVGHELRRSLAPLGEVVATTRTGELPGQGHCERLDFRDVERFAALFDRVAPDVVVNAAAYTDVDRAEDEPDQAFLVNAEAPGEWARLCTSRGASLVHYSTDYVFDGNARVPYREDDAAVPLSMYGASKLAGEKRILASGATHLILRTAWVYAARSNNFLHTMLRLGKEHGELRVVDDQRGCPTPAWLVANATAQFLARGIVRSGVRHLVAGGEATRYVFAQAIFDEARKRRILHRTPVLLPVSTAEYPMRARRPLYSVLDAGLAKSEYGLVLPDWRSCLTRTLETMGPATV